MTLTADIIQAHAEHPDWTPQQIAAHTGASDSTVRNVAGRKGLTLPPKKVHSIKRQFRRATYAGAP